MGVRGRRPKPTELKKLAGNPGKRPLNEAEMQAPPADKSAAHMQLGKDGEAMWNILAPMLAELGVLKATDLPALEMTCLHYGLARRAWRMLDKSGLTAKTVDSIKGHPAASIFIANSRAFKGYLTEFGLTPSSRSRLPVSADGQQKEKSLAEMLFEDAA